MRQPHDPARFPALLHRRPSHRLHYRVDFLATGGDVMMTTAEQLAELEANLDMVKKVLNDVHLDLVAAHRAGYELARMDALKSGWHLLDYDVMMARKT